MPASVVVGGQFGSEGKGKVAHFFARERRARFAVRVGGSNSGHTVIGQSGKPLVFRHLPTACLLPNVISILTPGNYIHVPTLLSEIRLINANPKLIAIDPNAWIIGDDDLLDEAQSNLRSVIGSTGSGTGAALVRRIKRSGAGTFARDILELKPYIRDTGDLLALAMSDHQRVIVEGTQGFGLSILHSRFYPYCTSRDTTAAGVISEAGLSPLDVDEIVLVVRSFPIRVAGTSGPLPKEIDWATVTSESGSLHELVEYTSVTHRVRRVARFDATVVKRAIEYNRPTCIALNHLDHVDAKCATERGLTDRADDFVKRIEALISAPISLLGLDPAILVRRDSARKAVA